MDLSDFDRQHIWHPYTSMTDPLPTYTVESARGVRIRLSDGRELIDGMSSWWSVIHGYNHPALNEAVRGQLARVAHVMFGGFTHGPAVGLARRLVEMTPAPLDRVFFSDSGSVAVEVAIKMALQYWSATGRPGRRRLLTIRGGYHGDTLGAMSVCDPVSGMHSLFTGALPRQLFAPRPRTRFGQPLEAGDLDQLEQLLDQHQEEIAALILEPVVQGAGGMWFYSADWLAGAAQLCRAHDVLLIADEIASGFGRTGRLFACEHAGAVPDILCLGKALTGGYMSLGATLTTPRIAEGISGAGGVLMHGPTFMANPLATAVAERSMDLLLESPWQSRVRALQSQMELELARYRDHPLVADVRVLGGIGVVETTRTVPVARAQRALVEAGIWLRPFGSLIYMMPPYVIEAAELSRLTAGVGAALDTML
ncbi:MAG: adenosylmethionine--8-amino-7-oxononanoate transaminase [Chromatiales bacterium]|nr:adenosylmethionine--8-amino-7-oxononanoate transaminase [Chromatiales bacterium]